MGHPERGFLSKSYGLKNILYFTMVYRLENLDASLWEKLGIFYPDSKHYNTTYHYFLLLINEFFLHV